MAKGYTTSPKISKSSGIASDDDAYDNANLLSCQVAKFCELMRGEGHWHEKMGRIKPLIGDLSGKKILDLGTQVGTYALYLSKTSKLSIGVDFSYAALKRAAELREQSNCPNTHFIQADVSAFPFADKTFDVVIGCDIVEHLVEEDLERMLKESYRVMKSGGIVVLQTYPNRYWQFFMRFNISSIIPTLLFWLPKESYSEVIELYLRTVVSVRCLKWKFTGAIPKGTHVNFQTLESILDSVTAAGFKIDKAFAENTYSNYERTRFAKLVEKITRNNIITKQNIYLKARKIL